MRWDNEPESPPDSTLPNHDTADPHNESTQVVRRLAATAGFVLVLTALGFGIAGLWPFLAAGHRRLEPWKIPLLWLGDLAALYWFTKFFVRHCLAGEPLRDRPITGRTPFRAFLPTLCGVALAMGIDLTITLYEMYAEHLALGRAETTVGQVYAFRRTDHPESIVCRGYFRFVDQQGVERYGQFGVAIVHDKHTNPDFPAESWEKIRAGVVPFDLRVSYDPTWPDRCWASDAISTSDFQPYVLSVFVLVAQLCLAPIFVGVWLNRIEKGSIPWWHEFHQVYPAVAETIIFLLLSLVVQSNKFGPDVTAFGPVGP